MSPSYDDLLIVLKSGLLPELDLNFDSSEVDNLFKEHSLKSQELLYEAVYILNSFDESNELPEKVVVQSVLLCGEHSESSDWTCPSALSSADNLLKEVLRRYKPQCLSFSDLLLCLNANSFLSELRHKLSQNSWKRYPAAVSCFKWILINIMRPSLGELLDKVLPICLLLVDDHSYSNKVNGLICINHIALNVASADLLQYERGTVIFKALEHMLYLKNTVVIHHLGLCLTALLSKTVHKCTTSTTNWSHFDDVLNVWLSSMEIEQKIVLQEVYIQRLNGLLDAMGISTARWSKKLLNVLSDYAEQDHLCDNALLSLQTYMKAAWPKVSSNFHVIVVILMKILIKISRRDPSSDSDHTLQLTKNCFQSLEKLAETEYKLFMTEISEKVETKNLYILLNKEIA